MKKKRVTLWTGALSLLGLVTYLGHRRQLQHQRDEAALLAEVRAFFAPMGLIEVVYVTEVNSRADQARGGVVFEDGGTFEFRYDRGVIDYRIAEEGQE